MSDIAIRGEKLSKLYRIGLSEQRHETVIGAAGAFLKAPFKNLRELRNLSHFEESEARDVLWALRDVSFEVRQGEAVGIIGRNGAGKSTLLKILSRITDPTYGRAEVFGRVASLLEVGTGFHPDLTGRENVYLNGTILGMKKWEIDRKFDEIVQFSGVEKFIDTPVKRYSSGMRARLAFSVAAHLEAEILIIDEVLAVGDAAFQKQCLGKMSEVATQGRTVLFVSHNMGAVGKLCESGVLLEQGSVQTQGTAQEVILQYLQNMQNDEQQPNLDRGVVQVNRLNVEGDAENLDGSRPLNVRFGLHLRDDFWRVEVLLVLRNSNRDLLVRDLVDSKRFPQLCRAGSYDVQVQAPALWLSASQYSCHIKVIVEGVGLRKSYTSDPLWMSIQAYDYGDKQYEGTELLMPDCRWTIEMLS